MKLSKSKKQKPCKCGSTTLTTEPNSYDVYEIINGKLEFQNTEIIDDKIKFYCRDCGNEYEISE
jgi:hypothetical protein